MEPNKRIPHDDWADQDLLTRDEAAERLVAEISEAKVKIAAGDGDPTLIRRLAAMEEAHEQLTSGNS